MPDTSKKFIVYVLRTSKGTLYTGQTNNLERRMRQHKEGKGSKYMRAFGDFELVYQEEYETVTEALKREHQIKQLTKNNKENLIKSKK